MRIVLLARLLRVTDPRSRKRLGQPRSTSIYPPIPRSTPRAWLDYRCRTVSQKRLSAPARLLRELIATPSVNPGFLPAGDPHAGEAAVASLMADRAARLGIGTRLQKVLPGRSNLIARLRPTGRVRRRVLLGPHLDTVGGDFSRIFKPRLARERLYGRGACDTKGSVAAMWCALERLTASGDRPSETEIWFAGFVDEENGQRGSRAFAKTAPGFNLAIVGEPTRLDVVTAHKGALWLRLTTSGKAAHGAKPHLGVNAVHRMAKIVSLIEEDYRAMLNERLHPLLGHPTINVGSTRGGSQPNIVPDKCQIEIDRRTLPGESDEAITKELNRLIKPHVSGCTIEDFKHAPSPPMETDPSHPLVRQLMKTARLRSTVGVDYFCDASILSTSGIPSIVFGPGDIAQAHTADEWISLNSLDRATDILESFLRGLP